MAADIVRGFAALATGVLAITLSHTVLAQQTREEEDGGRVRDHRTTTADGSGQESAAPAGASRTAAGRNSLTSIVAVDVSRTELRVALDYSYDGAMGAEHVAVTASALQPDGTPVPGLTNDITGAIVQPGRGRAVTVLKRESSGPVVRSRHVKVCLSHRFSGQIACTTIPHTRVWGEASAAVDGTCTVAGTVSGALSWSREVERGGRRLVHRATLTEMQMTSPSGQFFTAPLRGRRYVFQDVPAGSVYTLEPRGRFRADPSSRRVDCRRNLTFRNADFEITGQRF